MKDELDATSALAPLYAVASIQSQSAMPYCVKKREGMLKKEAECLQGKS